MSFLLRDPTLIAIVVDVLPGLAEEHVSRELRNPFVDLGLRPSFGIAGTQPSEDVSQRLLDNRSICPGGRRPLKAIAAELLLKESTKIGTG